MKLRQHFRTCSLSGIFSAISKRHLNNGTYCTLFLFIKIRGWPFFPTVKMAGKKGEEKKEKTKEIRNKCAPAASESWQPRQLRCMYTCASVISGFLPRARSMVSAWLVSHIESETFGKGYACLDFNLESRPQQATNSGSPPKPKKTDKKKVTLFLCPTQYAFPESVPLTNMRWTSAKTNQLLIIPSKTLLPTQIKAIFFCDQTLDWYYSVSVLVSITKATSSLQKPVAAT